MSQPSIQEMFASINSAIQKSAVDDSMTKQLDTLMAMMSATYKTANDIASDVRPSKETAVQTSAQTDIVQNAKTDFPALPQIQSSSVAQPNTPVVLEAPTVATHTPQVVISEQPSVTQNAPVTIEQQSSVKDIPILPEQPPVQQQQAPQVQTIFQDNQQHPSQQPIDQDKSPKSTDILVSELMNMVASIDAKLDILLSIQPQQQEEGTLG